MSQHPSLSHPPPPPQTHCSAAAATGEQHLPERPPPDSLGQTDRQTERCVCGVDSAVRRGSPSLSQTESAGRRLMERLADT